VNVVVEDPVNRDLLYVGTDHGTYLTLDGGKAWHLLAGNLPNVANYDMMVHPRDNELLIATHGRSVFVMDVKPLQALKDGKSAAPLVAFGVPPVSYDKKWGEREYPSSPKRNPSCPSGTTWDRAATSPLQYRSPTRRAKPFVPSRGSVKPVLGPYPGT
jgi:hypothetical protein